MIQIFEKMMLDLAVVVDDGGDVAFVNLIEVEFPGYFWENVHSLTRVDL